MLRRPVGAVCRHCGLSLPETPPRVLWSVQVCRHSRIRILASERGSSLKHRSLRGEILRRRAAHCAVGYHSSSPPSMQSTAIVILSKNPSHGGSVSPYWPHEESWRLLARTRLPMPTSPLSSPSAAANAARSAPPDGGPATQATPDARARSARGGSEAGCVVHDAEGQTLTVWLADPAKEAVYEETTDRGYGFMLVVSSPFVAKELKPLFWKIK